MVGRMPVACQSATRPGVQTRACARRREGSSTWRARVVWNQALSDRAIERGPQRGSDVRQRRRGVRLAEPIRFLRDCGEERGQPSRRQLCQPDLAEVGDEEPFDVVRVREPRGGPDSDPGGQPVPQPPLKCPRLAGLIGPRVAQRGIAGMAGCRPGRVAAPTHPLPPTHQICHRHMEIPTPMPALGQLGTGPAEPPPARGVLATAPFEDHTLADHDDFSRPEDLY
jgi:hypothetical protein